MQSPLILLDLPFVSLGLQLESLTHGAAWKACEERAGAATPLHLLST